MFASSAGATSPGTETEEKHQNTPSIGQNSVAKILGLLQPYNRGIAPAILEKIAADIAATQNMEDFQKVIAILEALRNQCQFDPESLAYMANMYKIGGNIKQALAHFQYAIDLSDKATTPHHDNTITMWRYHLSILLTEEKQYDKARISLALAMLSGDNSILTEALIDDVLKVIKTLNNDILNTNAII
jgi:tetratricopeptide (TPR) repeat protein